MCMSCGEYKDVPTDFIFSLKVGTGGWSQSLLCADRVSARGEARVSASAQAPALPGALWVQGPPGGGLKWDLAPHEDRGQQAPSCLLPY